MSSSIRIAVVGSGPAGFFVAEQLLGREGLDVRVDMYERLCAPFGLVRFGVAPDHQKIKSVTRTFDKVAARPGFRFFGNVEVGKHVTLDELKARYHAVCFATGAQTDRALGIPGEDLGNSHAATEFVAWFNGHPDYRNCRFDLTAERVAVIGVGNVAVDVARILCRTPEELARTDITDYALEALRESRVREVCMLGRRGPAQAAFTNPEVRELGEMPGADIEVKPDEVELDPVSRVQVDASDDRSLARKLEILGDFARREPAGKPRRLTIRFLVSPVELLGDEQGRVRAVRLVRNALQDNGRGGVSAVATDVYEELPAELVFRSVGYRGVPIAGLPFDDRSGIVPNDAGRVFDPGTGTPISGVYVAGWIKRGPTGVIGTNKPDAAETVEQILSDLTAGLLDTPDGDHEAVETWVRSRRSDCITYGDWHRLNGLEVEQGKSSGRPRVKFVTTEEIIRALRGV